MERVTIVGKDRRAMADLLRVEGVQVVRQTLCQLDDGRYRVPVFGGA